jgi:hypothetical protein
MNAPDMLHVKLPTVFKRCSACDAPHSRKGQRHCKACHAAYMREWRKTRPPTEEELFKRRARALSRGRVRIGKMERKPCRKCGAEKAEIHHPDYSRPLHIEWLCRPCHLEHHREAAP